MAEIAEMVVPDARAAGRAPLLELRDITKSFGGLTAVGDLSLQVYPREIVSIIGPNGAGKTTVFNLITSIYQPNNILDGERNRFTAGLRLVVRRLRSLFSKAPLALLGC